MKTKIKAGEVIGKDGGTEVTASTDGTLIFCALFVPNNINI